MTQCPRLCLKTFLKERLYSAAETIQPQAAIVGACLVPPPAGSGKITLQNQQTFPCRFDSLN